MILFSHVKMFVLLFWFCAGGNRQSLQEFDCAQTLIV